MVSIGIKRGVLVLALLAIAAIASAQTRELFEGLHEGDLLFVAPPDDNAITTVTQTSGFPAVDHVGIAHRLGYDVGGPLYVIEAISKGVTLTPIDSFIRQNEQATIIATRLQDIDAQRSIRKALSLLGRPYDWLYETGDSTLYCSELVQLCCVDSLGRNILPSTGMSFRDPQGNIPQYWVDLYARHGRPVPEGEPGTNPAQLLRFEKQKKIFAIKIDENIHR